MTFPDYDLIIADLFIGALDGLFLCDITDALRAWRKAGRPSRYRLTLCTGAVVNAQDGCISIEVGGRRGVLAVLSLIDMEIDVFRVNRDEIYGDDDDDELWEYIDELSEDCEDGDQEACDELEEILSEILSELLEDFGEELELSEEDSEYFQSVLDDCFDGDEDACARLPRVVLPDPNSPINRLF